MSIVPPEEIINQFKEKFGDNIKEARLEKHPTGPKKKELLDIWFIIDRSIFKEAVKYLTNFEKYPHIAVASGYDAGDTINLNYHFSIYYGGDRGQEITINFVVPLPKTDPVIETITDIIPGALITEQEKQEMLGVKVVGIPKDTRVFTSDDLPEGKYPWRRDQTGVYDIARNLHEVKKDE